jgi:hypothetical protein
LPLARAIIATGDRLEQAVKEICEFAEAHHLRVGKRDFPKAGRAAINISMHLGEDSFFHADNFVDRNKIFLNAYSHEAKEVWAGTWVELLGALASKYDVSVVKQP